MNTRRAILRLAEGRSSERKAAWCMHTKSLLVEEARCAVVSKWASSSAQSWEPGSRSAFFRPATSVCEHEAR